MDSRKHRIEFDADVNVEASRVQIGRACDHCRARKIRCDRSTPCANCVAATVSCITTQDRPQVKRQRVLISNEYERKIDSMEERLHSIESLLTETNKMLHALLNKQQLQVPVDLTLSTSVGLPTDSVDEDNDKILVVGGCGFLGHHIVKHLLARKDGTRIYVMGRSNSQRRRHGVEYLEGDITDDTSVQSVVNSVKPQVIINTVAPITYPLKGTPEFHYKVNVEGAANLIRAAAACTNTVAFVYTSSAHTLLETDYLNAKESDPVDESPDGRRYATTTKAIADRLTRSANNDLPIDAGGLRTACIRPCAMFGENDTQLLLAMLNQLQENRQGYQIGSSSAWYDFV
ncbi:NAD(P)-binding protein, partial [Aureobasidium melanogenum]